MMKRVDIIPLPQDKAILRIAGIGIILLFFAAARVYDPFRSDLLGCPFRSLTGYDCPTCGLSRSMSLLMNCRITDSLLYHPLGLLLVLMLGAMVLKFTLELALRKELRIIGGRTAGRIFLYASGSLIAVHWIGKLAMGL